MSQKTEKHTRKEIIDLKLKLAGWKVGDVSQVIEEQYIKTDLLEEVNEPASSYQGHQFSDYVLLGKNGKPIAVIEAKKTSKDAELGREQAKQYCYNLQKQEDCDLPFCFYTNGHDIYFWDLENYPPRKIYGFPTREDLERFNYIRKQKRHLGSELIDTKIAGRDYQIQAIRSVMEGVETKKRNFLLVMATGTGKTRTCIGLVDALMRAGWAERVLFLVDRIALRDQALEAFKEHLPHEPRWPKVGEKKLKKDRRIYVSTYPTMLNVLRDEKEYISPHFFDLIVVDESHRSIYNTYQDILNYFNSVVLGLTATPTDAIDHNTFEIFDCEDGLPDFAYTFKQAVENVPPYLSSFQVMKIKTKFQKEGINKSTISLEDQKRLLQEGKEVAEINYEGTDLEKQVINKGTNALIVKQFMEESIKDADGVLPGKTIFFCISKAHARRIEKIFDSLYPQYNGELAKVIVSEDSRVHGKGGLLDQFTNNNFPRVAISVDMLDTGIDVREIVNLVFAKPVFSYTKFWQMIGRGTRLLEPAKMKPWCLQKDLFLIMDCWDNFEYFKITPKGKELKQQLPLPVRLFGFRLERLALAIEKGVEEVIETEKKELQKLIQLLPHNSVTVMENKTEIVKVEEPSFWNIINDEKISFLKHTIKPLMKTLSGVDFKAMRFEKDVVETALADLSDEKEQFEVLKDVLIEQIVELPLSVNIVARHEDLIKKALTNHFWATITEEKYNELIKKLSPLMRFRQSVVMPLGQEKFNFKDVIVNKEIVEFGPEQEAVSIDRYREMVEERIRALVSENLLLQRIRNGEELTEAEVSELAKQLSKEDPYITENLLKRVYDNKRVPFIRFIKHILGLEILVSFNETVSKAFAEFIQVHNDLTSRQIQFLDILKGFILEKGELEKKDLINAPFTKLHPDGIRGVFSPNEIDEILQLTQKLVA